MAFIGNCPKCHKQQSNSNDLCHKCCLEQLAAAWDALEYIKDRSYPGLAVNEGKLLNQIYKKARQVSAEHKPPDDSDVLKEKP